MTSAMTPAVTRADRTWTAVVAECGLDRARPLLAALAPDPFARLDLAGALAATGLVLDRATPFAARLRPALEVQLAQDATTVLAALQRLPLDAAACPATAYWRGMFRDLRGPQQPDLAAADAAMWAAFGDAFRGRAGVDDAAPDWLNRVAADAQALRDLTETARAQRALPLTRHDRSLYARFGWNDDGDVPGLTGLLDAAALLRTRRAWVAAAPVFGPDARDRVQAAAAALAQAQRSAALPALDADARRLGLPRAVLAGALLPIRPVPPLDDILQEAA
jgi:hypothetical protein